MKVQVEDVSPIEKRLSIEVEPTVVEKELTQAYATLARQVSMPGFRPGKVPRRILEQKYRTEVEADVVKRVQLLAFIDAVREHNLPAVGDPHMSGGKLELQKPFAFTARVEVKPVISPKDYKGLTLKKFDTGVTDEKVNEQLTRLRESRTTLEAVTGRDVAQKGDMAVIDFDATVDGQPFAGNTGRNVTVEVTEGQLIQGNLPQLEGAKIGAKTEFDYSFPADYRVEEVKGKTARFSVEVKELKAKKVPELDQAFAESIGFGSVDELKARVRRDLERAAKNRSEADEREDVFKKLIEKNTIEVPGALVNRGIDIMLDSALQSMSRSGMDPSMLQLDWGKLREELRPRSDVEVRGQLILEAVAKAENIAVSDEDIEKKLETMAEETGAPLSMVRKQYREQDAKDSLKARILEEKAIEFLKSHAKFE